MTVLWHSELQADNPTELEHVRGINTHRQHRGLPPLPIPCPGRLEPDDEHGTLRCDTCHALTVPAHADLTVAF